MSHKKGMNMFEFELEIRNVEWTYNRIMEVYGTSHVAIAVLQNVL